MTKTLTPAQLRLAAAEEVAAHYPTKGTIIVVVSYNESIGFIVNATKEMAINFACIRLETNKAWITEVIKAVVTRWPTLPLPEKPLIPISLPIVKIDSQKKEVTWTSDGWDTYEGRRLATVVGGKVKPEDWTSFTGRAARTEKEDSACTAGC
jgi:hypothetical protein